MSACFMFPGQGSQKPGMGKDLAAAFPAARVVFDQVDDALGEKLSTLIFEGPEEDLTLTHNAQPALMAVSMAVLAVLKAEKGVTVASHASHVAGHSLGEYSALAAAGTFTIADAAKLLRLRGEAMQRAVPVEAGAMAALIGLDYDMAVEVADKAAQGDICQAANDNAPGQVVVSGHKAAVERAVDIARDAGAQRAVLLPVSAPFHCALMQPAADEMADSLAKVTMNAPAVPLLANVTAAPTSDPDTLRSQLVAQVTGTVRWRESVDALAAGGVDRLYEIGAGKVLCGLARRINRDLKVSAVGTIADIDTFEA